MVSKGGFKLINDNAIYTLKKIDTKSYLITPNIPEAEVLTRTKIKKKSRRYDKSCKYFNKFGCKISYLRADI